ncbi:MAG: DUF6544 family protein [Daejeonella sp.]
MRILFLVLIVIHGLIHLLGFAKAFDLGTITQLSKDISKPIGILWLTAFFLFLLTGVLFFLKKEEWWIIGIIAVIVSQTVIVLVWQDAKFGTIANILIATVAFFTWGSIQFEQNFIYDKNENISRTNKISNELLTEQDIQSLPTPVQHYLQYAGVINKPKVKNVRVVFEGQMRDKGKDYFPFTSEQFNFFDEPARLFYMKGKMFNVTVPGYHKYSNAKASMDIRLFGLFPIVKKSGVIMDKAETVTLFNDMCLLAPATLIDKRITWEAINDTLVKATFTNKTISITADLYFNQQGQLVNFISNDRTSVSDMKQYPFSTPVSEYQFINGYNLMSKAEAVWDYPDGKFTYGKFVLKEIEYNIE